MDAVARIKSALEGGEVTIFNNTPREYATEPGHDRFVTPMTNRREREANAPVMGKPCTPCRPDSRHPHKINRLARSLVRSLVRSFVLINETHRERASATAHVDLLDAVVNAIARPCARPREFVMSIIFVCVSRDPRASPAIRDINRQRLTKHSRLQYPRYFLYTLWCNLYSDLYN